MPTRYRNWDRNTSFSSWNHYPDRKDTKSSLSGKMLQMLGLYQNHAIQMEMPTAGDLLNHVIDMEKEQAEKKAVHLKMECEAFSMKMDPALMESLLINCGAVIRCRAA